MDNIKSWIVVILTAIFVACYVAALFGWQATPNDKIITALAPIVAVIIGYFFGRMPSEKIENSLTQQVNQKNQEAQQAQQARNAAEVQRTALDQKVHDAVAALSAGAPQAPVGDLVLTLSGGGAGVDPAAVRSATVSALRILQS
jgi:uncharacterized membrane protein YraQ (UPF0718 family)